MRGVRRGIYARSAQHKRLPAVAEYLGLARLAADATGLRNCFVQVASPTLLADFLAAARGA